MSAYDSGRILCRRCIEQDVRTEDLRAYLDDYVRELPPDIRTDESTYVLRLTLCESCPRRTGFTCTLCGCYVQTRAAKRIQKCPEKRW